MSAISSFGFRLFQELATLESGNIIFSPLSLWMVLAMAAGGSRNETLTQFLNVLKVKEAKDLKEISQELISKLSMDDSQMKVNIANGFGCLQTDQIQPGFLDDVKNIYRGDIFQGAQFNPKVINQWVSNHTHGKITNLLDESKQLEAVALLNAVYFNAKWKYPFKKETTYPSPFFTTQTSSQPCQMMLNTGHYRYYETDDFQAIRLPYKGTSDEDGLQISAIVILPKSHQLHKAIVYGQTSETFHDIINNLQRSGSHNRVELHLPKFKLDFETTFNQYLYKMGLHAPFLAKEADFSGIMDGPLYIETVLQKVFIAVDEAGTEAAAASAVIMTRSLPMPEPPAIEMRCDKPFLFAVIDEAKQDILFLASIKNVEKA